MKKSPIDFHNLDENLMSQRDRQNKRQTLEKIIVDINQYEKRKTKTMFFKTTLSIASFLGILFLAFQLTSFTEFTLESATIVPENNPTPASDGGVPSSEETESDSEEEPIAEDVDEYEEKVEEEEDPLAKYGDFYIVEEDYTAINTYAVRAIDEEADEIPIENVNIKDFARDHVNVFKEIPDHESERLINAGFPEEYYYYLSATGVQESIGPRGYIQVTGEEIEKIIADIMEVASVMVAEGKPGYPMGEEMEELVQQIYELFVELDEYVNGRDK